MRGLSAVVSRLAKVRMAPSRSYITLRGRPVGTHRGGRSEWRNFRPKMQAKAGAEGWPEPRVFPLKTNRKRTFHAKFAKLKPSSSWLFKDTYPEKKLRRIAKGLQPWSLSEEEYRKMKSEGIPKAPMRERAPSVYRLMKQVRYDELQRMKHHVLKNRHIENGFRAGDRVQITKYVSLSNHSKFETIKGMCLGRFNKGLDSHFSILNNKEETTFEMKVPLYSPWVKDIKILKRGNIKTSTCWYMRDRPINEFQT